MDGVFDFMGFSRPATDILMFLVHNPGPHTMSDIESGAGQPEPAISKCCKHEIGPYIRVGSTQGAGRKRITFALRSAEEVREMLFYRLDLIQNRIDNYRTMIDEVLLK